MVIGFNDRQTGVEQLALRHDDDIVTWRYVLTTENLSYQSFSSISLYRTTQFPGCRDTQAAHIPVVGQDEDRYVSAVRPGASIVDALVLGAVTNPLRGREFQLFVADRQALAALGATAFQHEAAIFCAHPHEKTMRARAAPRVGLERPFPLHVTPSESDETPIISDVFEGCQCAGECATLATLSPSQNSCSFGLDPKFSTTVEKAVEN